MTDLGHALRVRVILDREARRPVQDDGWRVFLPVPGELDVAPKTEPKP